MEADAQKLREKRAANLAMRSVWEEQIRQKLAVQQRLVDAENKWPFVNEHNPLERVLPEKRHANRIRTAPGHVAEEEEAKEDMGGEGGESGGGGEPRPSCVLCT